jgi:hypothetical protein
MSNQGLSQTLTKFLSTPVTAQNTLQQRLWLGVTITLFTATLLYDKN